MNKPHRYTKLDNYNYEFIEYDGKIETIRIHVTGISDVDIADIASDINDSDGNIYVERHYFVFNGIHSVRADNKQVYVDILVSEI